MPYIDRNDRPELDDKMQPLANQLNYLTNEDGPVSWAGNFTYVLTKLAIKTAPARRYWVFAVFIGVLICTVLEFYRRVVAGYEDLKINEHGDVDYKDFGKMDK